MMQAKPVDVPTSAMVQIILDHVQAKYPGNEWVKPCGPTNIANTCYDPNKPHITYHVYIHKERCENDESVSCVELNGRWIPLGKPAATEEK